MITHRFGAQAVRSLGFVKKRSLRFQVLTTQSLVFGRFRLPCCKSRCLEQVIFLEHLSGCDAAQHVFFMFFHRRHEPFLAQEPPSVPPVKEEVKAPQPAQAKCRSLNHQ